MDIKERYGIKDECFYDCIKDLINHEVVLMMDEFIQHGKTTTLDHCVSVSYNSYKLAKMINLDYRSVARGALLHDMFLYDWHNLPKVNSIFKMHGFVHAAIARDNAMKYFDLSEVEIDIIERHMWPLNLTKPPRYRESLLVSLVDKYVSAKETVSPYVHKVIESV